MVGMLQGGLLAIFLFFRRVNKTANKYLGLLMLTLLLSLLHHYFHITGEQLLEHRSRFLLWGLTYLILPILYLYIAHITSTFEKFRARELFHFLPALLVTVLVAAAHFEMMILGNIPGPVLDQLASPVPGKHIYWTHSRYLHIFSQIQILVYFILCFTVVYRYNKNIFRMYSNINKIRLRWMKVLLSALFVIYLQYLSTHFLFFTGTGVELYATMINLSWTIFILFVGYFGLWQPDIFGRLEPFRHERSMTSGPVEDGVSTDTKKGASESLPKYQRHKLPGNEAEHLYRLVLDAMNIHKMYDDKDITLVSLSQKLGTTTHCLSQVINSCSGMNFYNFINRFRVEEAQRQLEKGKDRDTVLSIGLDAGFNSKSSFNKFFKKFTGISPTQYRDEIAGRQHQI